MKADNWSVPSAPIQWNLTSDSSPNQPGKAEKRLKPSEYALTRGVLITYQVDTNATCEDKKKVTKDSHANRYKQAYQLLN